ncbi:MAG: class IV adenylate cyclase [Flavisolibacter sp.]
MPVNFEFKALAQDINRLENLLLTLEPRFVGEDRQQDTYFLVGQGRLKLREGNIENALIHYERSNTADAKTSQVLLYQHQPDRSLKEILTRALGIKTVVDKKRRIYFIENVKFHFDAVRDLGSFVEVEAIDRDGSLGLEVLQQQCAAYIAFFGIEKKDFVAESYSDLLLAKKSSTPPEIS